MEQQTPLLPPSQDKHVTDQLDKASQIITPGQSNNANATPNTVLQQKFGLSSQTTRQHDSISTPIFDRLGINSALTTPHSASYDNTPGSVASNSTLASTASSNLFDKSKIRSLFANLPKPANDFEIDLEALDSENLNGIEENNSVNNEANKTTTYFDREDDIIKERKLQDEIFNRNMSWVVRSKLPRPNLINENFSIDCTDGIDFYNLYFSPSVPNLN